MCVFRQPGRKRTAIFEQSLTLPRKAEYVVGAAASCVPGRLGSWPPDPQRLGKAASREVSQTRRGRGRSAVCLWMKLKMESACGAGAEPSLPFPNGEDWTFPPAPCAKQLSKQLGCPPPSGSLCLFHPPAAKHERDCILPASMSTSLPELSWTTGKEKWVKGAAAFLDRWASQAR